MPEERRRHGMLEQHVEGKVLAGLEFVADHRHLGLEILLGNEAVDHAIGFQVERPVQVFSARREGFEVVGPIERRRPIGPRPVLGQFLRNVPMLGRTLEDHVLQEVRHPGLAVPFISRSYQIGHVDSDLWLGSVRKQKEMEPVGESVLGDTLNRSDSLHALRERGLGVARVSSCRSRRRR